MAVESHYRNHSDSKSESSSDKWNNSEILAHFKRSQHNLKDAMRGYDMCIDYTSKRIDSVSIATLAPIREQHLHRTYPSQAKLLELTSRNTIWEWISHQPIACNSLPVFVSPKFNVHDKAHFCRTLLQCEQRSAQESFQVPDENRISKSNPWSLSMTISLPKNWQSA